MSTSFQYYEMILRQSIGDNVWYIQHLNQESKHVGKNDTVYELKRVHIGYRKGHFTLHTSSCKFQ